MTELKSREARLRRRLAKGGYRLEKTPARSWLRKYYGPGYQVVDSNNVREGCFNREYDATLECVEALADRLEALR